MGRSVPALANDSDPLAVQMQLSQPLRDRTSLGTLPMDVAGYSVMPGVSADHGTFH
jgi:hypothetical protein